MLFKLKLGQPRHRVLMRMMEEPEYRRALEKEELSHYADPQKKTLFALKEELFYSDRRKVARGGPDGNGPPAISTRTILDAFVLPDLATLFAEIDGVRHNRRRNARPAK